MKVLNPLHQKVINILSASSASDLPVILEEAHPLAVKLDSLIKQGKLPENRILYKFLNDTLSILINPRHKYDDDVLEFFNTIQHLGGKATVNFLRGP